MASAMIVHVGLPAEERNMVKFINSVESSSDLQRREIWFNDLRKRGPDPAFFIDFTIFDVYMKINQLE